MRFCFGHKVETRIVGSGCDRPETVLVRVQRDVVDGMVIESCGEKLVLRLDENPIPGTPEELGATAPVYLLRMHDENREGGFHS